MDVKRRQARPRARSGGSRAADHDLPRPRYIEYLRLKEFGQQIRVQARHRGRGLPRELAQSRPRHLS
jgi:hypothetical protein